MSASYNRIVLVGNLVRDAEMRTVNDGAVTKFTLAINRRTKQGDDTTFVDIVAWDRANYKLADICNTHLKKGMSVLVEGRLSIRSYDGKDGEKRKATEVVIDDMRMLDRPRTARSDSGAPAAAAQSQNGGGTAVLERTELDESDIANLFPE